MERNDLDELASVLTSRQSWPGHEVFQELLANVFLCPFYCSGLVLNLRSPVDGLARNIFIPLEIANNTIFLLVKGFNFYPATLCQLKTATIGWMVLGSNPGQQAATFYPLLRSLLGNFA